VVVRDAGEGSEFATFQSIDTKVESVASLAFWGADGSGFCWDGRCLERRWVHHKELSRSLEAQARLHYHEAKHSPG